MKAWFVVKPLRRKIGLIVDYYIVDNTLYYELKAGKEYYIKNEKFVEPIKKRNYEKII